MSSTEKVKEHFDSLSSRYEQNYFEEKSAKTYDFRTRLRLVTRLVERDSGSLLDCACGTGEITAQALKHGNFKTAVLSDISAPMLDIAMSRISDMHVSTTVQYQLIDIFKYNPGIGMKFDVIRCLGLLAHTGSLQKLLEHLKSMLSSDGKIILQSSIASHWGVRFARFLTSKRYAQKYGYEINYYTIKEIEKYVQLSGLEIKLFQRYNFGWPFGDKISRLGNYWLEIFMQNLSSKYGSDAVYIITHTSMSGE